VSIQIFKVQKEKGFRINLVDIIFILLLIGSSIFIYTHLGSLGYYFSLPLYIGFSFFLFCNVFRLRTKDEMIWTFLFLTIVSITFHYFPDSWVIYSIGFSFIVQVILIVLHVGSKGYRGVGAR
jgi:asparagine N-glycosylation enzyme membrane subunit Stt3